MDWLQRRLLLKPPAPSAPSPSLATATVTPHLYSSTSTSPSLSLPSHIYHHYLSSASHPLLSLAALLILLTLLTLILYVKMSTRTLSVATIGDVDGNIDVTNDIPSSKAHLIAADLPVYRSDGTALFLRDVVAGDRTLVIFIRHFLCGICQQYLRTLAASVPASSLPTGTRVVVIGCGSPDMIAMYQRETGCPYPILADPSRKIYDTLGMTKTLSLGNHRPEYQGSKGMTTLTLESMAYGLRNGLDVLKGGDMRQIGGEFLYQNGEVVWCHRMRNTRDHAEVGVIQNVLGVGKHNGRARMQDSTTQQRFH